MVNEVVYLFPEKDGVFFRYYSAECEVDFCGHGTIAAMYDYISTHPGLLGRDVIRIRVKNEHLDVYNRLQDEGCVYITAPAPEDKALALKASEISVALGARDSNIATGPAPALINAGLNTLIVPMAGLEACLALRPDEPELKNFCLDNGIDIIPHFHGRPPSGTAITGRGSLPPSSATWKTRLPAQGIRLSATIC